MESRLLMLLLLTAPTSSYCGASQLGKQRTRWSQIFEMDAVLPGCSRSLPNAGSVTQCAELCNQVAACQSFGFNTVNTTCLLYDHLVVYATNGTAAPGTRYFWLLSPRCPTELGYILEDGVCFKLVPLFFEINLPRNGPGHICSQHGGHLFIADTEARRHLLRRFPEAFVGASSSDKGGDWRWENGKPVVMEANAVWIYVDVEAKDHCLYCHRDHFHDKTCDFSFPVAEAVCEIPV